MAYKKRRSWDSQPQEFAPLHERWLSRNLKTVVLANNGRNLVNNAAPTSATGTAVVTQQGIAVAHARANAGEQYSAPHLNVGSAGDGSLLMVWRHVSGIAGSFRRIGNVGQGVTTAGFALGTLDSGGNQVSARAFNTSSVDCVTPHFVPVVGQIYCSVVAAGTTLSLYNDGALVGTVAVSGGVRRTASAKTAGPGALADVESLLFAEFDTLLTEDEAYELMARPWQLFAPQSIWVPVSAGGGTAALTGTATTATETDIVTGGKTIILTLTGDTWVAAGGTFDAQRQNIIDGIDSDLSEATGWDAVVKANQGVSGVVRTSDTVVTITLDAQATYNITATETITATIPASALTLASAIVASPAFQVTAVSGGAFFRSRMIYGGRAGSRAAA